MGTVRSEAGVMDAEPKELWAFHAAGLAGAGGRSYIDGVIMRDRDTVAGREEEARGTLGQRLYPLQNWRADVSVWWSRGVGGSVGVTIEGATIRYT